MSGSPIFIDIRANLNNSRHFVFEMSRIIQQEEQGCALRAAIGNTFFENLPLFVIPLKYGSHNEKAHSCAILAGR